MNGTGWDQAAVDRVLRRADWRFLTAQTHFERAACRDNGVLRDAVSAVSEAIVEPASSVNDCDLFVARDPSGHALDEGRRRLRVGACCYTEWSGGRNDETRALQLLQASGFRNVELYRPWPSAERAQVWFPIGNPRLSSRYFAREIRTADGTLRRLVRIGRHFAFHAARRRGRSTIAAVAHNLPGEPGTAIRCGGPLLLTTITQRWGAWGLGPEPSRLWTVMHTGGSRALSKVVTFVFADDDCEPRLVIKGARTVEAAIGLQRESEVLMALGESLSGRCGGIPRVLFERHDAQTALVCETAVAGDAVRPGAVARHYREFAEAAIGWLVEFGTSTRQVDDRSRWSDISGGALDTFMRTYGNVVSDGLYDRISAIVKQAPPPPTVCEHRDFSPWNILWNGRQRLSVVDWESSEPRGIGGTDAVYYLTNLAFYRAGLLGKRSRGSVDAFVRAYEQAWDDRDVIGRVNHACMSVYMTAFGIDRATLRALRVVTWLIHSASEYARLASAAPVLRDGLLRSGLFLNLLESECAAAAPALSVR